MQEMVIQKVMFEFDKSKKYGGRLLQQLPFMVTSANPKPTEFTISIKVMVRRTQEDGREDD